MITNDSDNLALTTSYQKVLDVPFEAELSITTTGVIFVLFGAPGATSAPTESATRRLKIASNTWTSRDITPVSIWIKGGVGNEGYEASAVPLKK